MARRNDVVRRAGSSDDEAQEAWIACGDGASPSYIAGAVRNLRRLRARVERRRREREALWAQVHPREDIDPSEAVERTELALATRAALSQLDEAMVRARYIDGRRAKDLAHHSSRSANTVRWQLKNALHKLRTLLTPMYEESMQSNEALQQLLTAVEGRLDTLGDGWSGRLVVHLRPSPEQTLVETVELIPTPPRSISRRTRRALQSPPLPGCTLPPFEMHFDISP